MRKSVVQKRLLIVDRYISNMLYENSVQKKHKILIVDDSQITLRMLEDILSAAGYVVIQSTNGKDAILLARDELPDLIVLDITMPGLDGIDVALSLKNDLKTRKIPIIFLSALVGREIRQGKDVILDSTFLAKPIDRDVLLSEIQKYL